MDYKIRKKARVKHRWKRLFKLNKKMPPRLLSQFREDLKLFKDDDLDIDIGDDVCIPD